MNIQSGLTSSIALRDSRWDICEISGTYIWAHNSHSHRRLYRRVIAAACNPPGIVRGVPPNVPIRRLGRPPVDCLRHHLRLAGVPTHARGAPVSEQPAGCVGELPLPVSANLGPIRQHALANVRTSGV